METPGNGRPVSSVTLPETVFSCAKENEKHNTNSGVNIQVNFDFIYLNFELVNPKNVEKQIIVQDKCT
ncbi:hypothetical protein GCM10011414_00070 [Croceivirga lutea]|nr:hypothetical protein GCM10011414_00070 [Croceivirga lutea]